MGQRNEREQVISTLISNISTEGLLEAYGSLREDALERGDTGGLEPFHDGVLRACRSRNWQVAVSACRLLRTPEAVELLMPRVDEVVKALVAKARHRSIQCATEASKALAVWLSTRPRDRDLPVWDLADPGNVQDPVRDVDQGVNPELRELVDAAPDPGIVHAHVSHGLVEDAVEVLAENLTRSKWKRSSAWEVGRWSALALGLICYARPDLLEPQGEALRAAFTEGYTEEWPLVYALTSAGYSDPDVVPSGFKRRLREIHQVVGPGDMDANLYATVDAGVLKLGRGVDSILRKLDLGEVGPWWAFQLHASFLLREEADPAHGAHRILHAILRDHPEDGVDLMKREVHALHRGVARSPAYAGNLARSLLAVTREDPGLTLPLVEPGALPLHPRLPEDAVEASLEVLSLVTDAHPEVLERGVARKIQGYGKHDARESVRDRIGSILEDKGVG